MPARLRVSVPGVVLAGLIAVGTTACGGGGKGANTRPAQAVATTTTAADPRAAERAAVLAAFDEYKRFYDEVVAQPDPSDPVLPAHLTGEALAAMQRDQAGFQSTHEGVRFSEVTDRHSIVSLDPGGTRAVLDDCVAAVAHYFDTRTGQPMGAPPETAPTSEGFEFVFVMESGKWKVSEKHSKPSACQQG